MDSGDVDGCETARRLDGKEWDRQAGGSMATLSSKEEEKEDLHLLSSFP